MELSRENVDYPGEAHCPSCGEKATEESITEIKLSQHGYLHGDTFYECSACENEWVHGVPVGREDRWEDSLSCEVCDGWYLVHRVQPHIQVDFEEEDWSFNQVQLHLKCPDCYHFTYTSREPDEESRKALVGYPQITGITEEAENYGYK